MTWAQRLKRVFNIDIEVCGRCGGSVKVIAFIENQDVIPDKARQALASFSPARKLALRRSTSTDASRGNS